MPVVASNGVLQGISVSIGRLDREPDVGSPAAVFSATARDAAFPSLNAGALFTDDMI